MAEVSAEEIKGALRGIIDPRNGQELVDNDVVVGFVIKEGNVGFSINIDPADAGKMEPVRKQCETVVKNLPNVRSCSVVLTAERNPPGANGAPPPSMAKPSQPTAKPLVPSVKSIIAVASGKGGVGKSTTAINLAMALARQQIRVGLLDADIYGPSVPRMAGVSGRPTSPDGHSLRPMTAFGVKLMSMGFLVEEDAPMIWRGPMVQSALQQMLGDVDWGELDVLVVDMPPGTGDAQLTMAQRVPLAGAVIVSTPQDIALLDARKAINMFRRVDVPVLGVIENMSYYICPKCGERADIFAHGGARKCADQFGTLFLGEIPLDIAIRVGSDGGKPIVIDSPDSPQATAYMSAAQGIMAQLEGHSTPHGPEIVFS